MSFSLPYQPWYYGLEEQLDGTWLYRLKLAYPGSIFFKPWGKAYRLSPRAGRAAEKAVRKIYWSRPLTYIACFGVFWFLITGFPVRGSVLEFMQEHRVWSIPLAIFIIIIIQNYFLFRVARFCRKIGTPIINSK